ncbi:TIGR03086 family metal-binding protein [Streptomyces fulvoviolaceus]|uniref:TIGR03086 family metal-binding protein n=1 Tax=Streptomyces fulvoviolaceus TaxID=285535 RepID=UPI0021C2430A|nr:TIGR03086 family metal-binding protein [Streptomyces fulvoviolaceus]MCT9080069.1 TIGR03086 family metal-binding protein [Streptomyces fulvoviolaceus]
MTDPRPVYTRATAQTAALIRTVRPEQLTGPTPCTEYDVRTLLSHVVGGTHRLAVLGEGGDGLAVRMFADDVKDDDWPQAYEEARTRALAAWASDESMAATVREPWGEVLGRDALSSYVIEIVAHTWDLSEGLGRPLELAPEPAEFALATARAGLPDGPREGLPFDAARPAPEGSDAYGQLAAWLGREPLS